MTREWNTCPFCGARLEPQDIYCVSCGEELPRQSQAAQLPRAVSRPQPAQLDQLWVGGRLYSSESPVIAQGDSYYLPRMTSFGKRGVLVLSKTALTFLPRRKSGTPIPIPLGEIKRVYMAWPALCWQMIGITAGSTTYYFNVKGGRAWITKIREAVSAKPYVAGTGCADYIGELRRLKELADEGIITREEFEAKKKQLLNA